MFFESLNVDLPWPAQCKRTDRLGNFSMFLQDTDFHTRSHRLTVSQLKIDLRLLSTLEPDLLHFVSGMDFFHAYFKLASPSRQFHTDSKGVLFHLSFPASLGAYRQLCCCIRFEVKFLDIRHIPCDSGFFFSFGVWDALGWLFFPFNFLELSQMFNL